MLKYLVKVSCRVVKNLNNTFNDCFKGVKNDIFSRQHTKVKIFNRCFQRLPHPISKKVEDNLNNESHLNHSAEMTSIYKKL